MAYNFKTKSRNVIYKDHLYGETIHSYIFGDLQLLRSRLVATARSCIRKQQNLGQVYESMPKCLLADANSPNSPGTFLNGMDGMYDAVFLSPLFSPFTDIT
ncbi:hypothetical protein RYX36_002124 [Vicia faba]